MTETLQAGPLAAATRETIALPNLALSTLRWAPQGTAAGSGREAVLLHGLGGTAATQAPVAAALSEQGWSVRAFDLPGHGWTRWLDEGGRPVSDPESLDPALYRLDNLGRVLRDALARVDFASSPVVMGHSWGSAVTASALLERAPITHAVLIEPPFLSADASLALARDLVASLRPDVASATEVVLAEGGGGLEELEVTIAAEALTQASPLAIMSAATENTSGPYRFIDRWREVKPKGRVDLIVGDPAYGGMLPAHARMIVGLLLGRGHVHYMPRAGHSPQHTHFPEFMALLSRILG